MLLGASLKAAQRSGSREQGEACPALEGGRDSPVGNRRGGANAFDLQGFAWRDPLYRRVSVEKVYLAAVAAGQ